MMEALWFKSMGVGFRAPMARHTETENGVSSRGAFHRALVGPRGRQTIQLRANEQRLLAAGKTSRFPAPGAERILLQRPPVTERQRPRQRTRGIDQAQMQRRFGRTLTSRQERNTGYGRGHLALQGPRRGFRHLLGAGLL